MLFNSYTYILFFLPVVAATYFVAGARLHHKLSIAWLVIASLFFYGWWNPIYLTLIVGSSMFNFFTGAALGKKKPGSEKSTLALLVFGITINLALLGYFKYANFFVDNVNFLTGVDLYLKPVFLPLAISFFTFQQISYLIDAYRKETRDYNFVHYLLFVTFFPQLIAGPIVHHSEMMPQFDKDETYKPRRDNIEIGVSIFSVGLFKKIILADNIALFSTPVFAAAESGEALSLLEAWVGAIAFGLQIYFDFSGYSDMAIGSARVFGIKLPINFFSPYKAQNIGEFWRRWHMTLTRFLTAYIYTPMSIGLTRKAIVARNSERMIFWKSVAWPAIVTFLLAGFWHGAGWNFVIFGALQGAYMIINNRWREFRKITLKQNLRRTTLIGSILARYITTICFIFSLIFFKAATTEGAFNMARAMLGLEGMDLTLKLISGKLFISHAAAYFAIIFFLPNTQQLFGKFEPSLEPDRKERRWGLEKLSWQPSMLWAALCAVMFGLSFMSLSQESEFIYFQF